MSITWRRMRSRTRLAARPAPIVRASSPCPIWRTPCRRGRSTACLRPPISIVTSRASSSRQAGCSIRRRPRTDALKAEAAALRRKLIETALRVQSLEKEKSGSTPRLRGSPRRTPRCRAPSRMTAYPSRGCLRCRASPARHAARHGAALRRRARRHARRHADPAPRCRASMARPRRSPAASRCCRRRAPLLSRAAPMACAMRARFAMRASSSINFSRPRRRRSPARRPPMAR